MSRKFIFLINPVSGTGNKNALKKLIGEKSDGQNLTYRILESDANGDYGSLKRMIEDDQFTDIIICGGDGTINKVASSLIGFPVRIGIIPMGSGNGLAFAAGLPKNPSRALDIIFKGNASPIDAFYINRQFSCMLCGLGFDAQVAHDFAKQPTRGLATYAKQTIRNFFACKPYRFIIHAQGKRIESEAFFISVANSNQFGNHVTIAPKASLSDGLLDVVIVSKMSKLRMVYTLLKQIRFGRIIPFGQKPGKRDVHYFQTKSLTIQNPDLAPLHIDGEPSETAPTFNIEIIEKAFLLIQP